VRRNPSPGGGKRHIPCAYSVNITETRQLHGQVIENVGRVAGARQKNERTARSSSVEHFESDSIVNMHEVDSVRRRIFPLRRLRAQKRDGQYYDRAWLIRI